MTNSQNNLVSCGSKQRIWKHILSYALTIGILAIFVGYAHNNRDYFSEFSANPYRLSLLASILCLILLISLFARAYFIRELVKILGGAVSIPESFFLVATSNMFAMLAPPPTGGAYRALYLRRHHGIQAVPFVSGTIVFTLVGVLIWSGFGMLGLISCGIDPNNDYSLSLFVIFTCAVALIAGWRVVIVLNRMSSSKISRDSILTDDSLNGASCRHIALSASIALFVTSVAQIIGFYLIFRLFVLPIGPAECISMVALHQLSAIVSLTPGAVGTQEAVCLFVASGIGLDVTTVLILFALIRVTRIALATLVGGPCWWLLNTRNQKSDGSVVSRRHRTDARSAG